MLNDSKNMFNELRQESPLVEVAQMLRPVSAEHAKKFCIEEKPFLEMLNMKGEENSLPLAAAINKLTGLTLPVIPNTVAESAQFTLFWLAPNEWLLQSKSSRKPGMEAALRQAVAGEFAAVVDVGSGNTMLTLTGECVCEVLAKGCPLDLHPSVFAVGQCAQTHYFKAAILLRQVSATSWELTVRRSFADYLARMLVDAAWEYAA